MTTLKQWHWYWHSGVGVVMYAENNPRRTRKRVVCAAEVARLCEEYAATHVAPERQSLRLNPTDLERLSLRGASVRFRDGEDLEFGRVVSVARGLVGNPWVIVAYARTGAPECCTRLLSQLEIMER